MEFFHIKGNTYCIDTGMTYIPFYKLNDQDIILLDSGWAEGEQKQLDALIDANNFAIKAIINTHAHIDHIGNNSFFQAKHGCVIAMPEVEAFICHSLVTLKLYFASLSLGTVEKNFAHMVCHTDIPITEQDPSITVCNTTFQVIPTPGHSAAHISLITPDNVAYIGDALISPQVMRGAKMPYAYILKDDLQSKKKLSSLQADRYIIAHKGCYNEIKELATANIDFYQARANRILSLIEPLSSFEEITQVVIKNFHIPITGRQKYLLIERMLHSYLDYLYDSQLIKMSLINGYLKYSPSNNE